MIFLYCIDKNYVKYAKVCIPSYKKYNPKAKIVVVSEEPIPNEVGYDENIVIKLPKVFRNRGTADRISNAAYLKLFLTQVPYDKAIFVDADTVCQKPLDELWDMPCEYINICESHSFGQKQAEALGLKRYANTGMMVMNLKELRELNFTEKCLEVEKNLKTPSTGWQHDETCINVAMKDYLTFVDKKFNYCHNRKYDEPMNEEDACILHYIGADKADMIDQTYYGRISVVKQYIQNKRVAIVGNAKSIFDKKNGEAIDDHDTIIRFNKGYIYQPECQGNKTTIVFLACNLTRVELMKYNAKLWINRSNHYYNPTGLTVSNQDRKVLANRLGAQPSTGFIAIDVCLRFGAKTLDLYGFDWEKTPTFYNPTNYVTQHNYSKEEQIVKEYCENGLLTIY